jgi:hypothetical protein
MHRQRLARVQSRIKADVARARQEAGQRQTQRRRVLAATLGASAAQVRGLSPPVEGASSSSAGLRSADPLGDGGQRARQSLPDQLLAGKWTSYFVQLAGSSMGAQAGLADKHRPEQQQQQERDLSQALRPRAVAQLGMEDPIKALREDEGMRQLASQAAVAGLESRERIVLSDITARGHVVNGADTHERVAIANSAAALEPQVLPVRPEVKRYAREWVGDYGHLETDK